MSIRKMVIAGFVLAAVGLTAAVTTVVIGQPPATEEKSSGDEEKTAPPAGATKGSTDATEGAGAIAPPASDDTLPAADEAAAAGSSSSAGGAETEASAPPADLGSAPGTKPVKPKGGKSSTKRPRSGGAPGGGMMSAGPPGGGKMGGMMSAGPAGGGMMGSMSGMPDGGGVLLGGMMSAPVSEDEHLETWVSRALADYARNEDQDTRKQQQDQIASALDRIFDIRQERRMEELETLEQRVQKLRGTLETREKLKADILKNRLDYLIREADGLGWGDGLPAPGRSAPTGMRAPGAGAGSLPAPGGPVFGELFNSGGAGGGGGLPASGAGSRTKSSRE